MMEFLPDGTIKQTLEIPPTLALLPIRDLVVFPYMVVPLMVSREMSVAAVDEALSTKDRLVVLAAQQNETEDEPTADAIHRFGTVGMIMRMRKLSDGRIKVLVQGLMRARITGFVQNSPCFTVSVERVEETALPSSGAEAEALMRAVRDDLTKYSQGGKLQSPELMLVISGVEDPGRLADLVASNITIKVATGQALLEEMDPVERLRRVGALVQKEVEILEVQATIQSRAKEEMSKAQREYFLREQLRQIQSELGGTGSKGDLESLRGQVETARMPPEARAEADRQLRRLEQANADSAEAGVLRTYLEWLVELPWVTATDDKLDLAEARTILDEDHYGLEDVKDRILEHLGVLKLTRERGRVEKGPILCFVGPPGVGKTSLGRSIARALGRKFVRMSLGGVRDEAEIRGHRRTYVGAMPGRVIQSLKQAGTVNPVFVLDEIDKLGADFRGDPSSALLEVLDPEQNSTFRDHYLGVAYDLSKVLFIATANAADPIPRALGDRMEVIRLAGYSEEEKLEITRRHVLPRQLSAAGLEDESLKLSDATLRLIVNDYTREAGLRDLERQIARIARKCARQQVEDREAHKKSGKVITVTPEKLRKFLGPPMAAHFGRLKGVDEVGAATGLAWTPYGGEVLEVEAQWMPGKGSLILTGQLGDVMKESAMTALSYARARSASLGLKDGFYAEREIHIHVPAGAVPKDGPSAGVTMACALVSLLTNQAVRRDVAMTGEITLRGRVLPVGGLKEKLLAAARAGIVLVIVPADNARDLEQLPQKSLRGMRVVLARTMDDVLAAALKQAESSELRVES
ncbi:MAG: ATP-dependent proteinase, Serine peptidase family [Myxococcales bacterium]|nr:ATP-dependent proteinase, Serine peptidase family [Myxococcales bacterium]